MDPASWSAHHTKLPISSNASRRWTVLAAGFLLFAIALVVIYTGSTAFHSPLAAVVLAAIGLAIGALFAGPLRLSAGLYQVSALGAVGCFGISSLIMLDGMRKNRVAPK
ncbi:MAG: hypothetical protein DMG81_03675 [Acidobacteria bacterium]|nr:MAG: hypothetical protein DMG81_03675 [Acidobacteriota bacterium]